MSKVGRGNGFSPLLPSETSTVIAAMATCASSGLYLMQSSKPPVCIWIFFFFADFLVSPFVVEVTNKSEQAYSPTGASLLPDVTMERA